MTVKERNRQNDRILLRWMYLYILDISRQIKCVVSFIKLNKRPKVPIEIVIYEHDHINLKITSEGQQQETLIFSQVGKSLGKSV